MLSWQQHIYFSRALHQWHLANLQRRRRGHRWDQWGKCPCPAKWSRSHMGSENIGCGKSMVNTWQLYGIKWIKPDKPNHFGIYDEYVRKNMIRHDKASQYMPIWDIRGFGKYVCGEYIYTHMYIYIYICESTVGSSSVMFIVHWCPRATNLFHPRLVAQDARRSHMEGKSDRWRCFGIREFNTYTITVKDQYKHKHWVTAHSQVISRTLSTGRTVVPR